MKAIALQQYPLALGEENTWDFSEQITDLTAPMREFRPTAKSPRHVHSPGSEARTHALVHTVHTIFCPFIGYPAGYRTILSPAAVTV
jgi:hypothetical protein